MSESKSQGILSKILGWSAGFLILMASTAVFVVSGVTSGVVVVLCGLLIIPPVQQGALRLVGMKRIRGLSILLFIVAVFAMGTLSPYRASDERNRIYEELTQSTQNRSPIAERYVHDASFISQQVGANVVYVYPSVNENSNSVDSVNLGTKVKVYEENHELRRSLIGYNFNRKNVLTGKQETVVGAAWIDTKNLFDELEYKKLENPGIEVTRQWVTQNSIGVPVVNLTLSNSTGKDIDGVRVRTVGVNNFGEFVRNSISGDDEFIGYSQDVIKNQSSSTVSWTLNLFDSVTSTSTSIYELHFTDGTKWVGNITHTMDELLNKFIQ